MSTTETPLISGEFTNQAELERINHGYYSDLHPMIVQEKVDHTKSELNTAISMENELNLDYKKYNFID